MEPDNLKPNRAHSTLASIARWATAAGVITNYAAPVLTDEERAYLNAVTNGIAADLAILRQAIK